MIFDGFNVSDYKTTIMTSLNSEKSDKICIHCSGGIGRTGLMYVY